MKHLLLSVLAIFSFTLVWAQEEEKPLWMDIQKAEHFKKERQFEPKSDRGGGSLSLPFFDDFSTYSLPTSDPDIPASVQRWENDYARINCTFPILAPTIGVATLDGLDETGYPYQFIEDAYGSADTLTSLPIDLSGLGPDDNVYLTFFYQGKGRGNAPDEQDSLLVEFFAPIGGDQPWSTVWSIPGEETDGFTAVFIPVDQSIHLQNGFKFRFRNYSTLSGNLDHWHIDYVFMNNNIDPENFDYFEVAFAECPNTLLQNFTSMPWTHFQSNPSQFMRNTIATTQRNLSSSQADNVTSGFKVEYDGMVEDYQNDFSIIVVQPNELFTTDYAINSAPNDFVFDDTVSDTTATFNVSFYEDPIGILADQKIGVPNNDSLVFQQVFQNYYAYDDGSAESAYNLNVPGGRVAMQYNIAQPDTLLGIFMHFTPFQNNNDQENFLLRVYGNNNGIPGDELVDNFQFHSPQYYTNGYDPFVFYPLDDPIEVDGTIYVGFVQDSNTELNLGLDKNTNANPSRLFFQLGLGGQWQSSGIEGSVMIRPVFKSGMTNIWNNVEEVTELPVEVYPNPTQNGVNISWGEFATVQLELYDAQGRKVMSDRFSGSQTTWDLSFLDNGIYILQILDDKTGMLTTRRILKQ